MHPIASSDTFAHRSPEPGRAATQRRACPSQAGRCAMVKVLMRFFDQAAVQVGLSFFGLGLGVAAHLASRLDA
jgi:hypothetical protein